MNNSSLPNPSSSHVLPNSLPVNANYKVVADHIYAVLPLNVLQRLVVKGVVDHVIKNKGRLCVTRDNQLLLYVKGERGIGKSLVINVLEIGFALLDKRNKLVFSVLIGYTSEDIGRSIVYTALSINTYKIKSLSTNISGI